MDDWFIYSKIFVDEILDFVVGSYWGKQKGRFFCHHPQSFSLKIGGKKGWDTPTLGEILLLLRRVAWGWGVN